MIDWSEIEWEETIEHPEDRFRTTQATLNLAASPILAKMRESTANIVSYTGSTDERMAVMWYGKKIKSLAERHHKIPCIWNKHFGSPINYWCPKEYRHQNRNTPEDMGHSDLTSTINDELLSIDAIDNETIAITSQSQSPDTPPKTFPLDETIIRCIWSTEIEEDDLWHDQEELLTREANQEGMYVQCSITYCEYDDCITYAENKEKRKQVIKKAYKEFYGKS